MKIAHLTTVDMSLRYLLLPQLEAAADLGEVIGISAPGEFVADLEKRGIRHVALSASTRGANPLSDLRAAIQLWRVLRRERVDILHTHNPKPGVYGRIVGRLAGVPIIVNTVHGLYASEESSAWKRALVYALEWFASRFSDAELVQNPEDFELMTKLRITPRSRTHLLGNGVDLGRFHPVAARGSREEIRAQLGVDDNQVVVGMVGRLVAEKGIPELIAAAERLDKGYAVVIVGPEDPEKADALEPDLLDRAEAAEIRMLGMRPDIERLYGAFDLFVLPSHREGFPRAAMEAAASGLPVIATDVRGCRQIVTHRWNGYLFPVGDVDTLARAIVDLGSDPELRALMGQRSADRAVSEFDEDEVVRIVMSTYRDLACQKGLEWAMVTGEDDIRVREATPADVRSIAELHRRMISAGFLSTLGVEFLSLLYGALVASPAAAVFVADSGGVAVGFITGTADTGAFYKHFIRRHGLRAAIQLAPSLLKPKTIKGVYETLRHGSGEARASAELLSMAVAPGAQRRGLGRSLVERLLRWSRSEGITGMVVVVSAGNESATRLYESCGFEDGRMVEVHQREASWEFLWSP